MYPAGLVLPPNLGNSFSPGEESPEGTPNDRMIGGSSEEGS